MVFIVIQHKNYDIIFLVNSIVFYLFILLEIKPFAVVGFEKKREGKFRPYMTLHVGSVGKFRPKITVVCR